MVSRKWSGASVIIPPCPRLPFFFLLIGRSPKTAAAQAQQAQHSGVMQVIMFAARKVAHFFDDFLGLATIEGAQMPEENLSARLLVLVTLSWTRG
jgi:hypothetical protein